MAERFPISVCSNGSCPYSLLVPVGYRQLGPNIQVRDSIVKGTSLQETFADCAANGEDVVVLRTEEEWNNMLGTLQGLT